MHKPSKARDNVEVVCRDALLHLASISDEWLPVLWESVASVRQLRATDRLRIIVHRTCNQLMSALDYIATWAQSVCTGTPKRKPYFFFSEAGDSATQIAKKMSEVFPGLDATFPQVHRFLAESQALLTDKDSGLGELRRLNRLMKHHRLFPEGKIQGPAGVTIVNWSAQADRPPMWIWARAVHMSPDSSISGGPGSLVAATDTITFDNKSRIFGYSGTDVHANNASPDLMVLDFVPLWEVADLATPVLQFLGMAVNGVARIVRQFLAIHGFWERLWPEQRIAHFGQVRTGVIHLNPGRIAAHWQKDLKSPSVALITWGDGAEPVRD